MYENGILSEHILHFSESDSAVVTKTYWTLRKEEIANLSIFLIFSFFAIT